MIKKTLTCIGLVILFLVVVVFIKTSLFRSQLQNTKAEKLENISEDFKLHLSNAIKIKTISSPDTALLDTGSFNSFKLFLESSYPLVHAKLKRIVINNYSYIYVWEGTEQELKPYILVAHSDVVPVEDSIKSPWTYPPYSGTITDNAIWGRGANDDKGSLIAILEAVEGLLKQNYQPKRCYYLCFGHQEEVSGKYGAPAIVDWLEKHGVNADLVIDEGGFNTIDNFKDLNRPIALLGVCEKGYVSFDLDVDLQGGHSSMPSKETALDILSKAIVNVRKKQMPPHITLPTEKMLQAIGPEMSYLTKMAIANQWLFKPLLISNFENTPGTNASIRTTIVPTIIHAGIKDNVIPGHANATINCRILPGENIDEVTAFIKKAIDDKRVKIKIQSESFVPPSDITDISGNGYKVISSISYKLMDNVVPVPFLMIGSTDGRFYRKVSDNVINYSPMLDPQGFHGVDERITFDDLNRLLTFYTMILKN